MRSVICLLFFMLHIGPISAQNIVKTIATHYPAKEKMPGLSIVVKDADHTNYYNFGVSHMMSANLIDSLTNFRLASVSKQFTAMSICRLIESNKLNFDTPISSLLPELPPSTKSITVGHLLNHSSGILDYESIIPADRTTQLTDQDVLTYVSTLDSLYFEPGTQFRYSNTGYCLLALIVERVTQKPFDQATKELIFDVLDLKATVYPTLDDRHRAFGYHPKDGKYTFADQSITSSTKGDGGVYISPMEYNKWLDRNNSLFSSDYWKDLNAHKIAVKDGIYYSLGWFLTYDSDNRPIIFHSGESTGFHNIVMFAPSSNQMISIFSNRDDLKIANLFEEINTIDFNKKPSNVFLWLNKVYMNQ